MLTANSALHRLLSGCRFFTNDGKSRFKIAGGSVLLLSVLVTSAGCVSAPSPNTFGLDAAHFDQVQTICRSTVGVSGDDPHFGVCIEDLANSLTAQEQGRVAAQAELDCASQSADPQAHAICVLPRLNPRQAARPSDRFQMASEPEVKRRVELSCAKLGLDPTGAAFATCVSTMRIGFSTVEAPVSN